MSKAIVLVALRRERQRKAAVVAETIEHASMRVASGGLPVLALVEKQPGLLAAPHVDVVLDAQFLDHHGLRNVARENLDPLLEPLEDSGARIVSRQNPARADDVVQRLNDGRRQLFHALRQRLHDEIVAVAIDDERRQQVGFAVNEPIRSRVDPQRRSKSDRRLEATPDQGIVGRRLSVRQHPERDLRSIAVERCPKELAARFRTATTSPGSAFASVTSER